MAIRLPWDNSVRSMIVFSCIYLFTCINIYIYIDERNAFSTEDKSKQRYISRYHNRSAVCGVCVLRYTCKENIIFYRVGNKNSVETYIQINKLITIIISLKSWSTKQMLICLKYKLIINYKDYLKWANIKCIKYTLYNKIYKLRFEKDLKTLPSWRAHTPIGAKPLSSGIPCIYYNPMDATSRTTQSGPDAIQQQPPKGRRG